MPSSLAASSVSQPESWATRLRWLLVVSNVVFVVSNRTSSVEPIGSYWRRVGLRRLWPAVPLDDGAMDPLGGGVAPLGEEQQLRVGAVAGVRHDALVDPAPGDRRQLREQPGLRLAVLTGVVVERPLRHREDDRVHALLAERELEEVHLADDRVELGLGRDVARRELEDARSVEAGLESFGRQLVAVAHDVGELDPEVRALG
jgi:hypothetical protein